MRHVSLFQENIKRLWRFGYGGDMPEDLACDLLNDIDFSFNKVCCCKIESMLPQLNKTIEQELDGMA